MKESGRDPPKMLTNQISKHSREYAHSIYICKIYPILVWHKDYINVYPYQIWCESVELFMR